MAVGGIPQRGLPDRGWPDRGIPAAPAASGGSTESRIRQWGLIDPSWFALCILFLQRRK